MPECGTNANVSVGDEWLLTASPSRGMTQSWGYKPLHCPAFGFSLDFIPPPNFFPPILHNHTLFIFPLFASGTPYTPQTLSATTSKPLHAASSSAHSTPKHYLPHTLPTPTLITSDHNVDPQEQRQGFLFVQ